MPNMRTLLALFGLLAACSLPAQKAAVGLQGSVFLSTPKLDEVHYDFSAQAGFTGGVFFRIPVLKGLFLQPEAAYARRPLRGTYSYETYNALDRRVTLDYAADQNIWELGGVLLYQFGEGRVRPSVAGGMAAGFLSDKKVQYTRDGAPYATTTFTHNDVSVILEPGASIPIGRKLALSLGLRYQLAFNYQEDSPLKFSRIGARHQRFGLRLGLSSEF